MSQLSYANQTEQKIPVIHSYNSSHKWTESIKSGLGFIAQKNRNRQLYHEYLDSNRYPAPQRQQLFYQYLKTKYAGTHFAAIVTSDDAALALIRQHRSEFFPKVPIIYLGINSVSKTLMSEKNMTGVFENRNLAQALYNIKKLTGLNEIVLITDHSPRIEFILNSLKKDRDQIKQKIKIHEYQYITTSSLKSELKKISPEIAILQIGKLKSMVA